MGNSLLYVVQVETEKLRARVEINGFEAFNETNGEARTFQGKANAYIIDGENHLRVSLAPELDEELKPRPATGSFKFAFIVAPHGRAPPPEAVRFQWEWPQREPEIKLEFPVLTPVWEAHFTVPKPEAFGRWAWQDAVDAPIDELERNEIGAVIREVHDAFASRDAQGLQQVLRQKHQELARALDVGFAEIESGFQGYLEELFQDAGGAMKPLVAHALLLRKMAGGRAVLVTTQKGEEPIQGEWNGSPLRFGATVAKIANRWTIVR